MSVFVPQTWTEACGPDATCINRPNGLGYDCRCHLGKSGNKCTEGKMWCFRTVLVQWGAGHRGEGSMIASGLGPLTAE